MSNWAAGPCFRTTLCGTYMWDVRVSPIVASTSRAATPRKLEVTNCSHFSFPHSPILPSASPAADSSRLTCGAILWKHAATVEEIVVPLGTTCQWIWGDDLAHCVDGEFRRYGLRRYGLRRYARYKQSQVLISSVHLHRDEVGILVFNTLLCSSSRCRWPLFAA